VPSTLFWGRNVNNLTNLPASLPHPLRMKAVLNNLVSGSVLWNEPMRKHTTFGIGGPADVLIVPRDQTDLQLILKLTSQNEIPIRVVGNGSDLLVSDDGVDGIVVKIAGCFNDVTIRDRKVIAGAGCHLHRLLRLVANSGLAGLEFATGIPGTVGGAVVMNAGTPEMEIGNLVTKVRAMNYNRELIELSKEELEFGYRYSTLQGRELIVISVEMELAKGDTEKIKSKMEMYLKHRKKKQPINFRSAGSIFKNPQNDFAGRLIESCGCKGIKIGNAQVSELHANFIVNMGNASARDVLQLMSMVQGMVFSKYGVKLEPEVKVLGRGITWKSLGQV